MQLQYGFIRDHLVIINTTIFYKFCFMQETFQKYKRNENIPEYSNDDVDQSQGELQRVNVQNGGEKQNLLSGEED